MYVPDDAYLDRTTYKFLLSFQIMCLLTPKKAASQPMQSTTLKVKRRVCVTCGKEEGQPHKIDSVSGEKKQLVQLLKYGRVYIYIYEGYICKSCEIKLLSLDCRCEQLAEMCGNTFRTVLNVLLKRCAKSPAGNEPPGTISPSQRA